MRKFLIKTVLFLILYILVNQLFGISLKQKRELAQFHPTKRWNEYRAISQPIDLLFLGSSHCYQSFLPDIFDNRLNANSFNMGSSFQTPVVSLYTLKEVLESHKIKYLILETHHATLSGSKNLIRASYNFDYYKSKKNKIDLIKAVFTKKDIINVLLPSYTYNNFKSLLFTNTKQDSTNNKLVKTYYYKKGAAVTPHYSNQSVIINNMTKINSNQFKDLQVESIQEIINICKDNDIKLCFITQPYNPVFYESIASYEVFHNFMDSIAQSNSIPYYDFNTEPYYHHFTIEDFYDSGHLFQHGAEKFSIMVAEKLEKQGFFE